MRKLLLPVCILSLAACAKPPTHIAAPCPKPLSPPAHLMAKQLPPAGSYSENARKDMQRWLKTPTN